MGKLALYAAAAAFASVLATVPTMADNHAGAPIKNGNQCWTSSAGTRSHDGWGYWGACPQTASNTTGELRHPRRPRRDPHSDR
jgi:hypothetical protein